MDRFLLTESCTQLYCAYLLQMRPNLSHKIPSVLDVTPIFQTFNLTGIVP